MTSTKPKRRRWFRFSLRTFLVVVTVLAVWIGWYVNRAEKQRRAVKWVKENGGEVRYDFQLNGPEPIPEPGLGWFRDLIGIDYFADVLLVKLVSDEVIDLTPLRGLPKLTHLGLTGTQVSDLTPLSGLVNLENLWLYGKQVSDLTPLSGLVNLEYLDIQGTQVSVEDAERLQDALPNCVIYEVRPHQKVSGQDDLDRR